MFDLDTKKLYLILGAFLDLFFIGLVACQFHTFLTTRRKNIPWMRVVWACLVIETVQAVVIGVYASLQIAGADASGNLVGLDWVPPFTTVATSVVVFITHAILTYRGVAFRKSHNVLAVLACASSILGLVFGCGVGIVSAVFERLTVLNIVLTILWLSFQMLGDLLLMGFLIVEFERPRKHATFGVADATLKHLTRRSIETGVLMSIFTLATLITFIVVRDANLFFLFVFPMGRVYTCTLLRSLNVRESIPQNTDQFVDCNMEISPGTVVFRASPDPERSGSAEPMSTSDSHGARPIEKVDRVIQLNVVIQSLGSGLREAIQEELESQTGWAFQTFE